MDTYLNQVQSFQASFLATFHGLGNGMVNYGASTNEAVVTAETIDNNRNDATCINQTMENTVINHNIETDQMNGMNEHENNVTHQEEVQPEIDKSIPKPPLPKGHYRSKYYECKFIKAKNPGARNYHNVGGKWICNICDKEFNTQSAVSNHQRYHDDPKFSCQYCKKMFHMKGQMKMHEKRHNGEKMNLLEGPFYCYRCNREFKQRTQQSRHEKLCGKSKHAARIRNPNPIPRQETIKNKAKPVANNSENKLSKHLCEICGKGFTIKRSLERHVIANHDVNTCSICSAEFNSPLQYLRHFNSEHSQEMVPTTLMEKAARLRLRREYGQYLCEFCSKTFTLGYKFNKHVLDHYEKELASQCPICRTQFAAKDEVDAHIAQVHKDVDLSTITPLSLPKCEICNRRFRNEEDLNKHRESFHSEYKTCPYCSKVLKKNVMKNHILSHTKEKRFQCPHCDRKFTYKPTLIGHLKSVNKKNPLYCRTCDLLYVTKEKYDEHVKTKHAPEKSRYYCTICNWGTNKKDEFKRHKRLQHKSELQDEFKEFQCEFCKMRFEKWSYCKKHYKVCKRNVDKVRPKLSQNLRKRVPANITELSVKTDFICMKCNTVFADKTECSNHIKSNHKCVKNLDINIIVAITPLDADTKYNEIDPYVSRELNKPNSTFVAKPFLCKICHVSYSQVMYFEKHISWFHPKFELKENSNDLIQIASRNSSSSDSDSNEELRLNPNQELNSDNDSIISVLSNVCLDDLNTSDEEGDKEIQSKSDHNEDQCTMPEPDQGALAQSKSDHNDDQKKQLQSDETNGPIPNFLICKICLLLFESEMKLQKHFKKRHPNLSILDNEEQQQGRLEDDPLEMVVEEQAHSEVQNLPSNEQHTSEVENLSSNEQHTSEVENLSSNEQHTSEVENLSSNEQHTSEVENLSSNEQHTSEVEKLSSKGQHTSEVRNLRSKRQCTSEVQKLSSKEKPAWKPDQFALCKFCLKLYTSEAKLKIHFKQMHPKQKYELILTPSADDTIPSVNLVSVPSVNHVSTPSVNPVSTPSVNPVSTPSVNPVSTPSVNPVSTPSVNPVSTPSVNLVSTPSVNLVSTSSLNLVSTPSLNLVSTPSVNLVSTPSLNLVSTPSVSLVSTPSVNLESTPVVNLESTPSVNHESTPSESMFICKRCEAPYRTRHGVLSHIEKVHPEINLPPWKYENFTSGLQEYVEITTYNQLTELRKQRFKENQHNMNKKTNTVNNKRSVTEKRTKKASESENHSEPEKSSENHSEPEKSSENHSEPEKSSENHSEPEKSSENHSEPDTSSENHSEPDTSSENHSETDTSLSETEWEQELSSESEYEPVKSPKKQPKRVKSNENQTEPAKSNENQSDPDEISPNHSPKATKVFCRACFVGFDYHTVFYNHVSRHHPDYFDAFPEDRLIQYNRLVEGVLKTNKRSDAFRSLMPKFNRGPGAKRVNANIPPVTNNDKDSGKPEKRTIISDAEMVDDPEVIKSPKTRKLSTSTSSESGDVGDQNWCSDTNTNSNHSENVRDLSTKPVTVPTITTRSQNASQTRINTNYDVPNTPDDTPSVTQPDIGSQLPQYPIQPCSSTESSVLVQKPGPSTCVTETNVPVQILGPSTSIQGYQTQQVYQNNTTHRTSLFDQYQQGINPNPILFPTPCFGIGDHQQKEFSTFPDWDNIFASPVKSKAVIPTLPASDLIPNLPPHPLVPVYHQLDDGHQNVLPMWSQTNIALPFQNQDVHGHYPSNVIPSTSQQFTSILPSASVANYQGPSTSNVITEVAPPVLAEEQEPAFFSDTDEETFAIPDTGFDNDYDSESSVDDPKTKDKYISEKTKPVQEDTGEKVQKVQEDIGEYQSSFLKFFRKKRKISVDKAPVKTAQAKNQEVSDEVVDDPTLSASVSDNETDDEDNERQKAIKEVIEAEKANSFFCDLCPMYYRMVHYLISHYERDHPDANIKDIKKKYNMTKKYTCNICGKKWPDNYKLKVHTDTVHSSVKFRCFYCDKELTTKTLLQNHLNYHRRKRSFKCKICFEVHPTQETFDNHRPTHAEKYPFECPTCERAFASKTLREQHLKTDCRKSIHCPHCELTFESRDCFKIHFIKHSQLECHKCHKVFATKANVLKHTKMKSCEQQKSKGQSLDDSGDESNSDGDDDVHEELSKNNTKKKRKGERDYAFHPKHPITSDSESNEGSEIDYSEDDVSSKKSSKMEENNPRTYSRPSRSCKPKSLIEVENDTDDD